jgi:hypothetical protein
MLLLGECYSSAQWHQPRGGAVGATLVLGFKGGCDLKQARQLAVQASFKCELGYAAAVAATNCCNSKQQPDTTPLPEQQHRAPRSMLCMYWQSRGWHCQQLIGSLAPMHMLGGLQHAVCGALIPCLLCLCRPHPWAPNKPPLKIIANTSVTPIDFLRDLVRFEGAPPL